jgi:hypothetical protein
LYVRTGWTGWLITGRSLPEAPGRDHAKFERELRLSGWAAQHRDEFGNWGKRPRATMRLNAAELTAFNAEYEELIARYSLRRQSSSDGRDVAIRFCAFPNPTEAMLSSAGS